MRFNDQVFKKIDFTAYALDKDHPPVSELKWKNLMVRLSEI